MKQFKDFNISITPQGFTGEKIKISKVLNCEITVLDYKVDDSKYGKEDDKCLCLHIEYKGTKHVVFTGSYVLLQMIQKVPKSEFPFITTIRKEDERFEFT